MGFKHRDRLARLHQQGFICLQFLERSEDGIETLPITGCLAAPPIDYQVLGTFCYLRVKVILDHAERCFGEPRFAAKLGTARGTHKTGS
jgi:hypothetical protein